MFEREGFSRLACKVCGVNFWSKVVREDCNDAPCSDYTFFNLRLGSGPLTVKEARDKFLNFFKKHGHEVVEPYPVVARWRDDIYLTIASIVVFQPHVTSGLVLPPANPLVIAQP
ncbi:MAG: alanine--tRNA ligase-related protein, partial [Zestosphaera sp.]